MTTRVETPQAVCRAGFARADITPPVGSYHRMWGAAKHERSTGIHRPLLATALWLSATDGSGQLVILELDHCLLDRDEFERIRAVVSQASGIPVPDIMVCMSHTHGSAWMSRSRAHLPGGDLIAPYLDAMAQTCGRLAIDAKQHAQSASVVFGTARCDLARHRDFWDATSKQFVCGFNPDGRSDDTVLVAKVISEPGQLLGTIVNYACHPTTLAWQNTLISPDYIGTLREVVEGYTQVPCLFLQGASGELGPKEGFVGDPEVADRNGRQLGFAALSGLEAIPIPGTHFEYRGPVVSGAILGTWEHRPATPEFQAAARIWNSRAITVHLAYRLELPTETETRAELAKWEAEESSARQSGDVALASDCRARAEQMTRQLVRLAALPPGKAYPFPVTLLQLGHSIWVFAPGELYQHFQITLRERFPRFAVVIAPFTNDWQPGYLPAASSYGYGIYQDVIAALAPGCLESLTESVSRAIRQMAEVTS